MSVCVFLMLFASAWFFIFLFLFAIMPRRRIWARAQSLSRRVFATCLSWMTDVMLGSCVFGILNFPLTSEEGRALARAVVMSDAVSVSVVPAWPMGIHTRFTQSQYYRRAQRRGWYFSVFFLRLSWRPRSLQKPISKRMREQSLRSKESWSGVGWGPLALRGRR